MINNSSTELYTVAEVAEILYAGKNTIYKLIHNGELAGMRIGRAWLIPHEALNNFIRTNSGLDKK